VNSLGNKNKQPWEYTPVVDPCNITAKEIQRYSRFKDLDSLLAYIAVICNNDINKVCMTTTSLTWFKEWMMYAKYIWGRTGTRWADLAASYLFGDYAARRCIEKKKQQQQQVLQCQIMWPMFPFQEEDVALQDDFWNERYQNQGVIFLDNTNVNRAFKPTDASLNRLTFSSYYSRNFAKGGVFLQFCGWLVVHSLWVGAVSDTKYLSEGVILELQQKFVENNDNSDLTFTNIVDKGYHCLIAGLRKGQYLLQPMFARSDHHLTTEDILTSTDIAKDRVGNECAMNICKQSGVIKHGLLCHGSPAALDDTWLAWSFQANFMFHPVL
jgi:hypothetical protein